MNRPLVSIITPVYNGEKYISRTLESIKNQGYKNIEYIVIDGGSTDDTLNIINSYKESVDILITEPDDGMYDAINKGIKISKGDIIAYINSDDYYFDCAIQNVVDIYNRVEFDFLYSNCTFVNEKNSENYRYSSINYSYSNIKKIGRLPFSQQSTFWSRKLFNKVGLFNTSYKYCSDTDYFLRCIGLSERSTYYLDMHLVAFRIHDLALSSKYKCEMEIEHSAVLRGLYIKPSIMKYPLEFFLKIKNFSNIIKKYVNKFQVYYSDIKN